jgi:hypothetical protein
MDISPCIRTTVDGICADCSVLHVHELQDPVCVRNEIACIRADCSDMLCKRGKYPVCVRDTLACMCACEGTNLPATEMFLLPSKFPRAVTLMTSPLEVLGTNLRICIGYFGSVFRDFPQSFMISTGMLPRTRPWPFLPHVLQFPVHKV